MSAEEEQPPAMSMGLFKAVLVVGGVSVPITVWEIGGNDPSGPIEVHGEIDQEHLEEFLRGMRGADR